MTEYTVLIVDDEQNVLKSLKRLFMETDYTLLTAQSGAEGLEILKTQMVHLVISDYRMPGMSGVEFLSRIKEDYPDTIRMILSGYADVNAIVDAINDGHVYKFLAKPWNDQELLSAVRRSFEHHQLQQENDVLLQELRKANDELKTLTGSLEHQVTERTQDLELKNRALQIAQSILGLLPVGVVGMDSSGSIVYANRALGRYLKTSETLLGAPLESVLPGNVYDALQDCMSRTQATAHIIDPERHIGLICTPLSGSVGVVGLFYHLDIADYARETAGVEANG